VSEGVIAYDPMKHKRKGTNGWNYDGNEHRNGDYAGPHMKGRAHHDMERRSNKNDNGWQGTPYGRLEAGAITRIRKAANDIRNKVTKDPKRSTDAGSQDVFSKDGMFLVHHFKTYYFRGKDKPKNIVHADWVTEWERRWPFSQTKGMKNLDGTLKIIDTRKPTEEDRSHMNGKPVRANGNTNSQWTTTIKE